MRGLDFSKTAKRSGVMVFIEPISIEVFGSKPWFRRRSTCSESPFLIASKITFFSDMLKVWVEGWCCRDFWGLDSLRLMDWVWVMF